MSDLFTEALKDSKKLREIAEQDAKNKIVEALTPYIKEMITKEASEEFFFEQDEEVANSQIQTTAQKTTTDPAGELSTQLSDQPTEAPISPTDEKIDQTADEKVTVDFTDLSIDSGTVQINKKELEKLNITPSSEEETPTEETVETQTSTADVELTPPVPTEEEKVKTQTVATEAVSYNEYQKVLSNVSERIDRVFFTESVSDISKETLKQRLFDLLEAIDVMKENGTLNGKQAKIQENKLEFLFLKLKEADLRNSYNKANNNQKDTTDMKSLKEFAAKLFEEDEHAKHAANVSGIDPKLGGDRKDIKASKHNNNMKTDECEEHWADAKPVIDVEDQDKVVLEAAAGFGDTDEEVEEVFEIDADELQEAIKSINNEDVRKRIEKLQEASDGEEVESWEDAEPEDGADPSHKKLKEGIMKEEDFVEDTDASLVLGITLPPEIEAELAELGLDDDDFDVDLTYTGTETAAESDDDEEIEIVDDEDEKLDVDVDVDLDVEPSSKEEDKLLVDMDEAKHSLQHESRKMKHMMRKNKLLEKKLVQVSKLLEKKDTDMKELTKQLAETNLFTAKAVYYSKFLQRALNESTLNKKVLQQIVEHLDKGKTVAETKAIYSKIDKKLNEHASSASRKLGGSSSKVAKPGSASLTEGYAPQAGQDPDAQSPERWQILAGIKRNSGK